MSSTRRKRAKIPVPKNLKATISRIMTFGAENIGKEMKKIPEDDVIEIILKAREIFRSQPMLVELDPPMTVLGDTHGDLQTLVQIIDTAGDPNKTNYLFCGDYVDRGRYGFEVTILLFCFKILRPKNFFLLRGNHESTELHRAYGFQPEVLRKQSMRIYKLIVSAFNFLPVAALVADQIFCCHGGISFNMESMKDILDIPRPTDIPNSGLLHDLTWNDPIHDIDGWAINKGRGDPYGYTFGKKALREWMAKHGVTLVIRAHQVVQDGYLFFDNKRLITVFSAPNYGGNFDNRAGMVKISKDLTLSVKTLEAPVSTTKIIWEKMKATPRLNI